MHPFATCSQHLHTSGQTTACVALCSGKHASLTSTGYGAQRFAALIDPQRRCTGGAAGCRTATGALSRCITSELS